MTDTRKALEALGRLEEGNKYWLERGSDYAIKIQADCNTIRDALAAPVDAEPDWWAVVDAGGDIVIAFPYDSAAHEHINEALTENLDDPGVFAEVKGWRVRPVYAAPPAAREPREHRVIIVGEHTIAELRAGRDVELADHAITIIPASDLGSPPAAREGWTDARVREFIGWLSADIPELRHVQVPLLAESLERFLAATPKATEE